MSTEQIIAVLIEERDRLNRPIEILGGAAQTRRGRPPGKKPASEKNVGGTSTGANLTSSKEEAVGCGEAVTGKSIHH